MDKQAINRTENKSTKLIPNVDKIPSIGDDEKKEAEMLRDGMSKIGSPTEIDASQYSLTPQSFSFYRYITIWGYGLTTFVIIFSGFSILSFKVDAFVQIVLILATVGLDTAKILKLFPKKIISIIGNG